jgi:pimeloyl-ACP methyl ester carboxylesterase
MNATRPSSLELPDGRRLDLWVEGPENGTPLVFHNGTPSSGLPFEPMVEAISERGLRYVSWSRPGYGDSTRQPDRTVAEVVPDTAAVLDQLGAERAYVVGWSGGGPHALACAALLPDRVIGTTTIASVAPYAAKGLDWFAGMGAENVEEFTATLEGPASIKRFLDGAWPTFRDVSAGDVATALGDLVDDVDRGALAGTFAAFLAAQVREGLRRSHDGWLDDDLAFARPWGFDLGSIRGTVHIWQGAHDRMVPFAHGQWLAAHIPTACVHLYPEHGHLSLAVDSFPAILDEMIAGQGSRTAIP